ncbi:MAG: sugar phosphate isomerase/epimerase [Armatimonadetes bacterium]|nr:sugar phosphate isomerase/epimerase [Armatimonadota bacterium]
MKIGALSAAWSAQPLEEVLAFFAEAGLQTIEIGAGAYPGNAHCNPAELNASKKKRDEFMAMINDHGLEISALSVHGNPLHPNKKLATEHHEAWRATAMLASKIGVKCVNGFSGLPGGSPTDKVPNWVVAPWPEDHLQALEYQWDVAVKYWKAENKTADKYGVNFCFEMHPNMLVYNPETLIRLREACGKRICCNFDPSHLWWQGIEPAAAVRWLQSKGKVIQHVHAKDVSVYQWNARVNGVLDTKHYGDELNRSWIFRSLGYGHDALEWNELISTLRMCGYDGALSIEHEDSLMTANEGFLKAVDFLKKAAIFEKPGAMTWA